MPIHSSQLEAAADALRDVLRFDHPADTVLSRYFRGHRGLGQNDRAFVAESVFGVLRRKRLLDHLVGNAAPRRLLLAYLSRIAGISGRELHAVLAAGETEWLAGLRGISTDDLPLAVQADFPDWLVESLRAQMPDAEILALGRALQQPAPLDLRVNTMRADRSTVLRQLAADGLEGEATPYSPFGIRLKGKPALNRHPLFLDGSIEVQDEGSQLLGCLVAPKRHELVVDFCAGAGGKTLMLGAMMQSHGRIYAFDVSEKRLARLKPRLKRSGLSNLYPQLIQNENDIRVKRLAGKIDRVLVDAPCSGLGTLRRNPDLKWRQSPQTLEELTLKQAAILNSAARLLKPGGRLVYATCSLLAAENQDIVAAFLAHSGNFSLLNCNEIFRQQQIGLDTGPYLQLWPHRHATDGFFAAAMTRNN
ncbi:MAG TPA: RsmB/NOP family class I SAM-dependent RNA methyltransferase [Burkholderiales bacterium]|nr:RsmB/NOP family class I SAM-dependent RNA methyltransferase [Burkholderiales bacterium]